LEALFARVLSKTPLEKRKFWILSRGKRERSLSKTALGKGAV